MDGNRRAAAVRRQMDYAAGIKEDAGTARQIAVLLGVKIERGKALDATAMRAPIGRGGVRTPVAASTAAVADLMSDGVALVAKPASLLAEIEKLKTNLADQPFSIKSRV